MDCEIAQEILGKLRLDYYCLYDEKDSIGKRYRRMDAIGTPFCITVDHQTKEDNTITLRTEYHVARKGACREASTIIG